MYADADVRALQFIRRADWPRLAEKRAYLLCSTPASGVKDAWGHEPPDREAQNSQSANQNAKRLHGAQVFVMYSPVLHAVSHTMEKKSQKANSSTRNRVSGRRKTTRKPRIAGPPVAYNSQYRATNPRVKSGSSSDGRITVKHKESICQVVAASTYADSQQYYEINPRLDSTFPWLSQVAHGYEFYEFKSLTFTYIPRIGTTSEGAFTMAVDYDAADDEPADETRLVNYMGAVQGPIWKELKVVCDKKSLTRFFAQRKMRFANLKPNSDVTTYDVGNLFFSAVTPSISGVIGNIFAEYTVDLMTPQIPTVYDDNDNSVDIGTTTTDRAHPFTPAAGTVQTALGSGVMHTASTAGGDSLIFDKPGEYLLNLETVGATLNETASTIAAIGTAVFAFVATNTPLINAAATVGMQFLRVKALRAGDGIKVDMTPSCATIASTVLRVAPYGYANA